MEPNKLPIQIRESVRALALSLVMLELLYFIIYSGVFILLVLGQSNIPDGALPFASTLVILLFLGLSISKVALSLLFVLHWLSHTYQIRKGEIIYTEGLIARREKIFSLAHVEDIVISQTLLGRVFNFGTIRLHNPVLNKKFYLYSLSNPEHFANLIREAIREKPQEDNRATILREDTPAPL